MKKPDAVPNEHRSSLGTRAFAFASLAAFVSGIGYVASQGYLAATDSFVAPIILSPDSDAVLASKLKIGELAVERARTAAALEAIDEDVIACDTALEKLADLRARTADALEWTEQLTDHQKRASNEELHVLSAQRRALKEMADKHERLARESGANVEAGIISRTEHLRETQALDQVRLALLENTRARAEEHGRLEQLTLVQRSLGHSESAPRLPEALAREEQATRMDLESMKLASEKRSKLAERRVLADKLTKIDEIDGQLRSRPMFRATERSVEVAFAPYTQIEGVAAGGKVYTCKLGLMMCRPVGTVAEVVPGEVVLPDPWGNQARGQYVILDLVDHGAAREKVLRVRPGQAPPALPRGEAVASSR